MANVMSQVRRAYSLLIRIASSLQSPFLLFVRLYWGWQFMVREKVPGVIGVLGWTRNPQRGASGIPAMPCGFHPRGPLSYPGVTPELLVQFLSVTDSPQASMFIDDLW